MEEKNISPEESLEIITGMISTAKSNFAKGGSFYFLLWGGIIACANFGHYILGVHTSYPHPYVVWLLVIPAVIITILYSVKRKRSSSVISSFDRLYGQLWWAVFVGIIVVLAFMPNLNYNTTPIILLFSAIGTYITGQILRFKPLIFGGITLALMAIVAFMLEVPDQFLLAGFAMLAGYVVPGFMLKREER